MITPEASPTTNESEQPRRSWLRRSVAVLLVGIVLVACFRDRPELRLAIARTADFTFSNIDPFSETHFIEFGPAPISPEANRQPPEWNRVISIRSDQPELPRIDEIEFAHEWIGHERVKQYCDQFPFEINSKTSVFEMSNVVRQLAEHDEVPLPDVGTDPLAYLKFATDGKPITCRYFSILLGATAKTAGYTSRLFTLSKAGNKRDHAVCEIYVPEFGKWVMIDPDFNVAYKRDGVWLDARELHFAWIDFKNQIGVEGKSLESFRNRADRKQEVLRITGIELVELGSAGEKLRQSNMDSPSISGMNLEFFQYVIYRVRNDYLSASYPIGHPVRTREYVLQEDPEAGLPPIADTAYLIQDIEKFYWPVGRSHIAIKDWQKSDPPSVNLQLSTWTPNFEAFELRQDEQIWTRIEGNSPLWKLHDGTNVMEARSINLAGLRGETSRIQLQVTPNIIADK